MEILCDSYIEKLIYLVVKRNSDKETEAGRKTYRQ